MAAAARTAGFLPAVSASGVVVHIEELIGAESLSQWHNFLCDLDGVVHDDACYLGRTAESQKGSSGLGLWLAACGPEIEIGFNIIP